MDISMVLNPYLLTKVDQGVQIIIKPMFGKDWNIIIEYINNKSSFFFDDSGYDTWIIPDPSVLILITNYQFLLSFLINSITRFIKFIDHSINYLLPPFYIFNKIYFVYSMSHLVYIYINNCLTAETVL